MWTEDKIVEYLEQNLKKARLKHSFSVMDTAIELAKIYNEDENKAKLAGLIHDCAKYVEIHEMLSIIKESGYNISDEGFNIPEILHGPVGAYIAKNVMAVLDEDILNSIAFHTIGRKNMSILEKIIYIADYIEPLRSFPGVEKVRKAAYKGDLDKALLLSFDNTIKYIVEKGQLIHKSTIEARNYILCNR